MKIIFVCTGNTCRSPMAEGFFRKVSEENNITDIDISSKGIYATEGDKVSEYSVISAGEYGVDISSHKASQLTKEDIISSYYIFTMTKSHKDAIISAFPDMSHKVFSVSEYADSPEISDPYAQSLDVYRKCAKDINETMQKIFTKIFGKK